MPEHRSNWLLCSAMHEQGRRQLREATRHSLSTSPHPLRLHQPAPPRLRVRHPVLVQHEDVEPFVLANVRRVGGAGPADTSSRHTVERSLALLAAAALLLAAAAGW